MNNLSETLKKASNKKMNNDILRHPQKVRSMVNDLMDFEKSNTLNLTIKGQRITFKRSSSNEPNSLSMNINGKTFSGDELNAMINNLDHIGPEYQVHQKIDKVSHDATMVLKNSKRTATVELTRSAIKMPYQASHEGLGLLSSLLRLLGRTIYKTTQTR